MRLGTPATTTGIIILPVFVSYLTATLATSELAAFFVAKVNVTPDDAFVELRSTNIAETSKRFSMSVILDKAKAAWCPAKTGLFLWCGEADDSVTLCSGPDP